MKNSLMIFVLSLFVSLTGCINNPQTIEMEEPDITISEGATVILENAGSTAYIISSIEGEGVTADTDTENTEMTIEIGRRYIFNNAAGASAHPLEFRDSERNVVLGQRGSGGSFVDDPYVNAVFDGNTITFTLTAELAELMVEYTCSFHPGMRGSITTV